MQPYGRAAMAVPAASEGKPKAVRDSLRASSASAAQEDAEDEEKEAKRRR